ncbi:MAG: hypothetical protein ACKN9U_06535 [Pirellulaceae bacterium]
MTERVDLDLGAIRIDRTWIDPVTNPILQCPPIVHRPLACQCGVDRSPYASTSNP